VEWFGKMAAISEEWRTALRRRLPDIDGLIAGGAAASDELRDLLRWDVQETGLRLLSVRVEGNTWVVALDDFGSAVPVSKSAKNSVQEVGAATLAAIDDFFEALHSDESFQEVCVSLSAIFVTTCQLLASAELVIASCKES
jgi:hypothetical protein